ncbi:MAG: SH3 domain-containing protein [Spirochaetota bacterium]
MQRFSDFEIEKIIESYNVLGLTPGIADDKDIRQAFNTKVKDNHPDSTQDPVLKQLYEDRLKQYIDFRDTCLSSYKVESLVEQINSYKIKKRITDSFSSYYKKSRLLRYAMVFALIVFGLYTAFDISKYFQKPEDKILNSANTTQVPNAPNKQIDNKSEVASAESSFDPKQFNDLFIEGVDALEKFSIAKNGLTVKEQPSFGSQTVNIIPFGTKLNARMTKKVLKMSGTYANWYYIQEANGFVPGEYLSGNDPEENHPLNMIENTIRNTYTTNLRIKFGTNVISLLANEAYYFPGRNDKDFTKKGIYKVKGKNIHVYFEENEVILRYKNNTEFEILSDK